MHRVLVLNANYEPLKTHKFDKAVNLVLDGKAHIVESAGEFHSENKTWEVPSVIVLKRYVNVPREKVALTRKTLFERDNYTCQYCGIKGTEKTLTIDHIVSQEYCKAHGINPSTWSNEVTACKPCNGYKANKPLGEATRPVEVIENGGKKVTKWIIMGFINPDFEPKRPRTTRFQIEGNYPTTWKKWIELGK